MSETQNPLYQRDNTQAVPPPTFIPEYSDETTKLMMDEPDKDKLYIYTSKPSFFQRHFKKLIFFGVCLLITLIIAAVVIPQALKAIMAKYMREAQIEVVEMEVTNIVNGTVYMRIEGSMKVNAPIEVAGFLEETYVDLLIPDPQNRSSLSKIGTLFFPAMETQGNTIYLNMSTTLVLESDRLFHGFINDVLYNQTVLTYMSGTFTITVHMRVYGGITVTEDLTTGVSFNGMNGLDFDLLRMDLYESTNDTVSLWFEINIKNPSQFYASYPLPLYLINIRLYYQGIFLGFLEPQDLFIGKGDSFNEAIGSLIRTPANEEAIGKFLSDYIMGFDVPVTVNGSAKVDVGLEKNPDFPATIYVEWVMPGIEEDLISALFADLPESLTQQAGGATDLAASAPNFIDITAIALIRNPLDFDIEVLLLEFDGWAGEPCNKTVSHILETYYNAPLLVPSKSPICVPMLMPVSLLDANCIRKGTEQPGGMVLYAFDGVLEVKLDQFIISVKFDYGPLYAIVGPCQPGR